MFSDQVLSPYLETPKVWGEFMGARTLIELALVLYVTRVESYDETIYRHETP